MLRVYFTKTMRLAILAASLGKIFLLEDTIVAVIMLHRDPGLLPKPLLKLSLGSDCFSCTQGHLSTNINAFGSSITKRAPP